ncbi:MAG: metal ABC transporter permease [Candidatus Nezhaarchaeales archaeon]
MFWPVMITIALGSVLLSGTGYYTSKLGLSTIAFGAAHAALAGAAIAYVTNLNPTILSLALATLLGAILSIVARRASNELVNNVIMTAFSAFNALALLSIYLSNTVVLATVGVGALLWGSPLAVTPNRFLVIVALLATFFSYTSLFRLQLHSIIFDRRLAEAEGIRVDLFTLITLVFLCFSLAAMLEVVGGFMTFTLLYVPNALATTITSKALIQLVTSSIYGLVASLLGALLSFTLDLPIGATIALTISMLTLPIYAYKILLQHLKNLKA